MNIVVPVVIATMFVWWAVQSISWYPDTWWNPFLELSLGTVVVQGGIMVAVLILLNNRLSKSIKYL